jgi:acyl-CoA reductase-like NAD-dependent aldehyde dehydrogenase
VCCAGSRVLVEESIHDEVLIRLSQRVQKIRVGDPLDKNSDMGAINSARQLAVIQSYVEGARTEGVHIIQGEAPETGCFFPPTVLTNVEPTSQVFQEEIFGPVVSMSTFRTADEAVQMANHTRYGLAAGVWTQDGARAMWTASKLKCGVVWENTYNLFDPTAPFGGVRESGWGREGGRVGMNAYLKEGISQSDNGRGAEGSK